MSDTPRVSVIVPAFNEERNILTLLRSLAAQTLPPSEFEVIVVDNGSTDTTLSLATDFIAPFRLMVVQKVGGAIGQLRNYGAALACADILVFLDADSFPRPDWLAKAWSVKSEAQLWGGDYLPQEDATWVGRTWSEFQSVVRDGPANFLPSGNLFVYRRAFERLGGFSELETSEDVEFCQRSIGAGLHVTALAALAVVHEGTPRSLMGFYRQNRWHGKHVLRMFFHQLPKLSGLRVVSLTIYTLLMMWAWVAATAVGFIHGRFRGAALLLGLLVLPSVVLALGKACPRGRWSAVPQLFVLYQTYLLARAAAIVRVPGRIHR